MKERLKVVIDTNIFVSALLGSSWCQLIITRFEERAFRLVLSEPIIEELSFTLKNLERASKNRAEKLIASLKPNADIVVPASSFPVCRDPDDNKFIEAAVAGQVDFIISGDKDLLALSPFQGITIIRPHEFIKLLKEQA